VDHYLLEQESVESFHVSSLRVRQMRDSRFASHTVLLGGRLVRNNVHAVLDGQGCQCLINGLFVPTGAQHMDNHMRVEHAQPHGDSRQFYQGILNGRATGVFSGRIVVHPGAQKTDAKQTNKNLLLSDDAHIDTRPQLEIYADDVKCTHGATIGQLDEQAVFYLRARGITEAAARALLIHAFAGESLDRMKIEPVRAYLDSILLKRLPGGELLERLA
jgi:Fe-S cluster assembly protein SufD